MATSRWFFAALAAAFLTSTSAIATSYVVDSNLDNTTADGLITLREAVVAASTNMAFGDAPAGDPGNDTITFDPTATGVSLLLGALDVSDDLTIEGSLDAANQQEKSVNGGFSSQVFVVASGSTLDLTALRISIGVGVNGGCIETAAGSTLILTDMLIQSCQASVSGGAIFAGGDVTMRRVYIDSSEALGSAATDGGGALYLDGGVADLTGAYMILNSAPNGSGSGGGIFNNGGDLTLTFDPAFFGLPTGASRNSAQRAGGGIEANGGTTTLNEGVELRDNTVGPNPGNGGGLHVTGAGVVNLGQAQVVGNAASSEGGGLWNSASGTMNLNRTDVRDNVANGTGADNGGGGVFNDGGTLSIQNANITGNQAPMGSGSGGGIFNNTGGELTINSSSISDNSAQRAGGGIEDNAGSFIELVDTNVSSNTTGPSPGNGGGLHVTGAGTVSIAGGGIEFNTAASEGGGLWTSSAAELTVTASATTGNPVRITNNTANGNMSDNGGGGVFNDGGTVSISAASILENSVPNGSGSGGGVFNNTGGTMDISDSTISSNSAERAGGGIEDNSGTLLTLDNVVITENSTGTTPGNGGGVHITGSGTVTMTSGQVTSNTAGAEGGGLWGSAAATLNLTGVTVDDNSAPLGGGIHQDGTGGTLLLRDTTISNNVATTNGGGINFEGGSGDAANITISGNSATAGNGGGISADATDLLLTNVTIAANSAGTQGGGISGTGVQLGNTVVSDNSAPSGADIGGTVVSNGNNVIEDPNGATGLVASDTTGEDPMLGPLADNGGPTLTHLPMDAPLSPTIDSGDDALATAAGLTTDQRGMARFVDSDTYPNEPGAVDVGAVEVQDAVTGPLSGDITIAPTSLTVAEGGSGNYTITLTRAPTSPVSVEVAVTGNCTVASGDATPSGPATALTVVIDTGMTAASVTVNGGTDMNDVNDSCTVANGPSSSTDPGFNGEDPADVSVTVSDSGFGTVQASSATVTVTEGGSTGFQVILGMASASDVVIPVSVIDGACQIASTSGTPQGPTSSFNLTIPAGSTSATVTASLDADDDFNNQRCTISLGITSSDDPQFDGVDPDDVTINGVDPDIREVPALNGPALAFLIILMVMVALVGFRRRQYD